MFTIVNTIEKVFLAVQYGVYNREGVLGSSVWCLQCRRCSWQFSMVFTIEKVFLAVQYGVYNVEGVLGSSVWCLQ